MCTGLLHCRYVPQGTLSCSKSSKHRTKRFQTRAFGSQASGGTRGEPVKVSFALPYRCEFGQNLSIIGSTTSLGSWDVDQSVDMEWTDGDVWRVELEIPASSSLVTEMEYKYVVKNHDGGIASWKPGSNFSLQLPLEDTQDLLPEKVRICDAWDSSCRDIEVELRSTSITPDASSESVQLTTRLTQEAEEALADLKAIVERSTLLLDDVSPVSAEALAADQAVAAAAEKASQLTRALNELRTKGEITEKKTDS